MMLLLKMIVIFWKLVLGQVNYSINTLITHTDLLFLKSMCSGGEEIRSITRQQLPLTVGYLLMITLITGEKCAGRTQETTNERKSGTNGVIASLWSFLEDNSQFRCPFSFTLLKEESYQNLPHHNFLTDVICKAHFTLRICINCPFNSIPMSTKSVALILILNIMAGAKGKSLWLLYALLKIPLSLKDWTASISWQRKWDLCNYLCCLFASTQTPGSIPSNFEGGNTITSDRETEWCWEK